VWTPARGILVSRVEGCLTVEGARALGNQMEQQTRADGKHLGFHDWEEMTNYDDDARVHLTEIVRRMRPQLEGVHILLRSRIVAFGVRTANIIIKVIQVHTERAPFEQALRDAILRKRVSAG
jgi:hypothetical protein